MNNIFDTVTIEQFREYFFRDFPFLNYYISYQTYKKDAIVFDENNEEFYKSLIAHNDRPLDDTEAWELVEDDKYNYITNEDIQKAMSQAMCNAKQWSGDCNEDRNIYLHLVAYYLVVDLKNSSQGMNSSFTGIVQSKSVGDVSESYAVPQWLQASPMYSIYGQNGYGLKYLSLIAPYLACTVLFSRGGSTFG